MKLVRYCVMNFRSVKNSGWIDCDDVTTLVGVNESGKSNLLLALWKLNPARGGEIDILHDMPVSELSTLRNRKNEVSNIDRCRVVYVDKGGFTVCSSDLRQGADTLNEKSIYAVHAAMYTR